MKNFKKYICKFVLFLVMLLPFNNSLVHAFEIDSSEIHSIECDEILTHDSESANISVRALICCDNPIKKTTYTGYIRGYDYLCYSTPQICYMRDYTKYKNVDCTNCGARLSSEVYDRYSTHTNPAHTGWDD